MICATIPRCALSAAGPAAGCAEGDPARQKPGEEWKLDPNRVGILGFSAGGHLAASAGTLFDDGHPEAEVAVERESSRPDLMVLCYPVISMAEYAHQGSKANLLGPDPSSELVERYCCEKQVTENTPPAFIWFTADDQAVPVENGLVMALALRRKHVPFELHIFESGPHGLGLALEHPAANKWTLLCERWLLRQWGMKSR
ncbi:alpha/beta hydrolase [Paenibacillus beijingensis]|uniref:alpha/beta hydrolase n=1 Tax=Paenibacillus beijingensis TaxID=1126833 RepID=UPI001EE6A8D6|nr:alpha/beta hydrolase [Paenibacillus beijingensis]